MCHTADMHAAGCPNPHGDLWAAPDGNYRCPRCRWTVAAAQAETPGDCQTTGHRWLRVRRDQSVVYRCAVCSALHVV